MTCPRCTQELLRHQAVTLRDDILGNLTVHYDCVYEIEWSNGSVVPDPDIGAEVERVRDRVMRAIRSGATTAALAGACLMALSLSSASAADITPSAPIGCVVQRTFEDRSAWAVCAGSYVAVKDAETDAWDIPVAIDTLSLTDDAGNVWAWPVLD